MSHEGGVHNKPKESLCRMLVQIWCVHESAREFQTRQGREIEFLLTELSAWFGRNEAILGQ